MNQGWLIAIIFYLITVLAGLLDEINKIGEFSLLSKQAQGENVPVSQLKSALINAIDLMILAISPLDDTTAELLNSAKLALEKTLYSIR